MKLRFLLIIYFLLLGISLADQPQDILKLKSRHGFKVIRRQPINFNVFLDYSSNSSIPILYASVSILNDVIQFQKIDSIYEANYQISIALRSENQSLLQFSSAEHVKMHDFKRTNSIREYQQHSYRLTNWPAGFKLITGTYKCLLKIEDLTTRKSTSINTTLNVPPYFSQHLHTSICFLRRNETSGKLFPLSSLLRTLPFGQPAIAFAHLFPDSSFDDTLRLNIFRDKKKVFSEEFRAEADSGRITLRHPLPMDRLQEGFYRLDVTAGKLKLSRPFEIIWFQKPTYLYEYELAMRPMRYILSKAQYEKADALSHSQLQNWFETFWKERDPSPNTVYNELQFEFFQRVHEANRKFSSRHLEGWETDRGRIYILYGPPLKIDNGRYTSQSSPYLIWEYANARKFIFIDKKRNGKFVLSESAQTKE